MSAEGICPFKGLASFEPVDADYFFGRERLVAELVARVVGAGFLGIVGPSGSGKSSVLRAGLLPALAGGVLPGSGAGGGSCCVPASGRWTSFAACSCRERRTRSPRPSTRYPPADASSSPSTSS